MGRGKRYFKKGYAHLHARKEVRFRFIYQNKNDHTVVKMCEVLNVSTSGYYAWELRLDKEETERQRWRRHLDEQIRYHFHDNLGTYGSPRIYQKLIEVDDIQVSLKTVTNRMREMGLYATPPTRYIQTTDSDHQQLVFKNELNRKFKPNEPNRVWATDITYIHTGEGFLYLNPVLDLFSRRVISYRMGDRMDAELPLKALKEALEIRQPAEGWIHHSDQGSVYCSKKYTEALKGAKATISMSRKATPYDNACVESFFASLKKEYLYKFVFKTKAEAMGAIQFYIQFYNRKRIHSTLEYTTPIEYEKAYKEAQRLNATEEKSPSA
ncbi:IS3 family transposase [Peribacillus sp. B-H-3]|uniref:IS3 family transposase n=1 Tax=Peribacillus sp. B-H-3 TaxID=3400420 RepID=UPI003B012988